MNHDQFNSREASELLGITPETLCKWIKTKGIPAEKVNLQWRFERDLLQRWIDKNQYQVPAPISGEPTDTDTLTSAQAAALLGISVSTLNGWAQKGKIQAVKRQRRWHYRRRDVEKLAAAKPSSQASPAAKSRSAGRSRTGAPRPYALGSTTGALLLMPSREAADLYRQEGNWDKAFQRAVDENILSSKSRASAKRQISEIFVRLRALNKRELELILDGDASDRRNILWLAACRRYRFLADFGRDVLAARLNDMKPDLLYVHYDNYLEEKLSEHPEIKAVSKASHKKLRSVLFAMLREAGYLDAQNNIVEADLSFHLARAVSREYRDDLHSIPVNENYLKEMLS